MSNLHALAPLLAPWLAHLRAQDGSGPTERRYRAAAQRFLAWHQEAFRRPPELPDFNSITLQDYRQHLLKTERLAPATINVHVAALRAWSRWLHDAGHIDADEACTLRAIKTTAPVAPRGMTNPEINALLRAAKRTKTPLRDYAIVQLMLQTGIRIGECAAITLGDIDFGEKGGTLRVRQGKGNKYREVPLNGSARAAIAAYVAERLSAADESLRSVAQAWPGRKRADATTALWISQRGQLSESGIWRIITGIVAAESQRGNIPPEISPHDLRHTFAQGYLGDHPGDLVGLAQILGHSDINTTAIYTRATAEELASRVEGLGLNAFGEEPRRTPRPR